MFHYGCAQWLVREARECVRHQHGDRENLGVRAIQAILNKGLVKPTVGAPPLDYIRFFLGRIEKGFAPTKALLRGLEGFIQREDVCYLTHPTLMDKAELYKGRTQLGLLPFLRMGISTHDVHRKRMLQFLLDYLGVFYTFKLVRANILIKVLDRLCARVSSINAPQACTLVQDSFHSYVNATVILALCENTPVSTTGQLAFKLLVDPVTQIAVVVEDFFMGCVAVNTDLILDHCLGLHEQNTLTC